MHNNSYLKKTFRMMLTFFAAAVLCAVLFALPSSAETYTWNQVVSENPILADEDIITIDDNTTATGEDTRISIPTGTTITVNGSASGKEFNFFVDLYENSNLIWNASVNSTGSKTDAVLTIMGDYALGVGTSVQINNVALSANKGGNILILGAGLGSVTMTDCTISNENGNGIGYAGESTDEFNMIGGSINVASNGFDSTADVKIKLTNVRISSRGISNPMASYPLVHEGAAELTNVTIINTNGAGAGFVDMFRTGYNVSISGGSITSTGIGIDASQGAGPNIAIEDCTIESSGADGVSIRRSDLTIKGSTSITAAGQGIVFNSSGKLLTIEGGTISGTSGVNVTNAQGVTITGDATIIGTDDAGFGINSTTIPLTITPTTGKIITVKGKAGAIASSATTLAASSNYLISPNYDGAGYTVANQDLTPYAPETSSLYAQFSLGTLPYVPPADPGGNTGGGGDTGGGDTGSGDNTGGGGDTGGNYIPTPTVSGNSNNSVNYNYNYGYPYGYPYGYRYGYRYGYCPMMFPYCRMPMYGYCNHVIYIVVDCDRNNKSSYDLIDDIYKEEWYDLPDDTVE
jgi:hypothetical protein